ncbi:hypothetical protein H9Y04_34520 [Streptomyces sp. TRM66268-LWL]|uniref:ORC1/DEAH AAA+ ATPase domain-containing protein n=1 Tax=Streptomyces polyasparticus TaxID=2767826 RepID=A0ABR7SRZ2_9ACTN|nr:AAA family ATPase [Streptomyces polyasparticus]MBC9717659.1 hypothetical protein [Streptomyces polyasparticus]
MYPHSTSDPDPAEDLTPTGLAELLASEGQLTLTGPPGVGKSHLAARVAQATGLPVQHVDLTGCQDSAQVPQVIADALGADTGHSVDPLPGLLHALAPQHGVLVLDTCEHVAAGGAQIVDRIRDACPKLRLLTTSRRPLGTADENLVAVSPMTHEQTEDLLRAQAAAHQVDLDQAWAHLLSRHIDGDPLSVVLMVQALRRMGPRQLFARLSTPGGRFAILTDGASEPARHRSLWRAVEWSYQLCGRREQLMWFRLSAFSCTFTRDQVRLLFDVDDELDLLLRASVVLPVAPDRYRLPLAHREYGRMQLGAFGLYGVDDDA